MYSLDQIERGLRHPNLLLRECNRLYYTRLDTRSFNTEGLDVMAADWDDLLLLDACRYDLFAEEAADRLSGRLERRTSRGSNTVEFLRGTVAGRDLTDTVYVTGNPQYHRHRSELAAEFHDVVDVWEASGWDETYNTVLPGTVAEATLDAAERYPDKRLFVHFVQPHYPFLTEATEFDKDHLHREDADTTDFWHRIMTGRLSVDADRLWELYAETLRRTLPHVERLLDALDGRTVVTADHGNMFGERARPVPVREWGHPESIHTPELVEVPWHVRERGERRDVVAEPPVDRERAADEETVNERLRHLGYRE